MYPWINYLRENIPSVYTGLSERAIFGIDRDLPLTEGPKGLAIKVANGIVVLFAPEPTIREREELTVGRLIGRLGENPRVRYLALQDETGFIFATKNVTTLSRLNKDDFLKKVLESGESDYRYEKFSGEKIFELAIKFPTMGRYQGVLRIGFSTAEHDRLLNSYAIQIGFILLLVFAVVIIAVSLLTTSRRLAAQKSLSDAILSEMSAACIAVDKEGIITMINPVGARLFGIQRETCVGKALDRAMPGDPLHLKNTLRKNSGETIRTEFEKGSKKRILDIATGNLPDGGAFAIAEDITDIIELRKEAASAEHLRALGELAAGVAHEIRNPLNAIGIAAQRLSSEFEPKSDDAGYNELLTSLKSEIRRLDNVIREFIGLSAPMAPNLVKQPLKPLLDEIVSATKLRAEGSGLKFENEITDCGEFAFDSEQLKKAILNLVKNAIEATPRGGAIRLACSRDNGELKIQVWDNGAPIPEKIREKLGKPFVSSGKEGGTGIGLFVAFRVARDHGGRIEIESDTTGTSFTIILPGGKR
jgi:PAS domain S-box-containing protein